MKTFLGSLFAILFFGAVLSVNMLGNKIVDKRAELVQLQAQIRAEEGTMRVLQADWALLTSPKHLENLLQDHLDLVAVEASDIGGTVAALKIPMPPLTLPVEPMIALSDS